MIIEIDDRVLEEAARVAAVHTFAVSHYGSPEGEGRKAIQRAVDDAARALDCGDMIRAAIAARLPEVVEEIVGDALARLVKAEVKAALNGGEVQRQARLALEARER